MMNYCPYCGTERLSDEAVFCMGCGKKLPNEKTRSKKSEGNKSERKKKQLLKQNETEDLMELYAEEQTDDIVYETDISNNYEEIKQYAPPVRKKRKLVDDYDGYYDDVEPYDKGRVREDNILEIVKKVFIIIIAALMIVAVCVVMMYIL